MKNFTIWVLFVMALCSCSKELGNSEDNRIVEDAKQYHLSQNVPLFFFTLRTTETKSLTNNLRADWERSFIRKSGSITYVEVPLQNSAFDLAIADNGKELPVSTRLIIEKDNSTGKYKHFIISKIWTSNTPDLSHKSIGDYSYNAYTFIYNVNGEIFSMFETRSGDIHPIIINFDDDKSSNSTLSIENCTIYLTKYIQKKTKIGAALQCYDCMSASNNYICNRCGLYVGGLFYISDFFYNIIVSIQRMVGSITKLMDCFGSCYVELLNRAKYVLTTTYANIYGINNAVNDLAMESGNFTNTTVYLNLIDKHKYHDRTIYINGVYEIYYFSPYCELSNRIINYDIDFYSNLAYFHRVVHTSCDHYKCPTCKKCLYPIGTSSSCNRCTCSLTLCTDVKCSNCGKCINPTRPDCDKCICCGHTLRCQSEGCGKLIRTNINTRTATNCSHSEDDFCPSSEAVCECGERHCNEETGLPKCTEASYWLILNSLDAGINHIKEYIKRTKIELAGISMTSGKTYIQYDPRNTSGESRFVLGQCKKLDGRIYFIDEGTLKKDYIEIFFHGHPEIENKIKTIEGKLGMYAHELSISPEDYLMLTKYGCLGLIVTEFGAFRFTSSAVESIFCPLYIPNN